MKITENELYQEIDICLDGGTKIGEAEVELKGKMLSRLTIFEPYQNKGYGTEVVKMLNEMYGCNCLWVNADNERAIHTYNKNGYRLDRPTMYLMTRSEPPKDNISREESYEQLYGGYEEDRKTMIGSNE